ncbi:3-deoxy-7-phosphoheptulonate synthase AroG [sulfur-oxidizing endosymbiont of Gigantopelta aegis]|uniref:3-deoxy-7-phosphoheptulonate synthase AroG n=1 Tax=sulfur-oxidizing endosymbiont of Gigantopelta aegis TaxID=2794934 RepID=UPI0018DBF89D|nr:3-deoxy-7-phosphoheptulonate synthase AroG [sulfur-oxidizing endosymbiont of Gigantopelta aegis]
MTIVTDDLRILGINEVIAPEKIHEQFPSTENAKITVSNARQEIHKILSGEDDRLIIIIGPCSIHDVKAATEYAHLLKATREKLSDDLLIVMRVYFEKPRTTVGWKGLINDPDLDGSFKINKGLGIAREFLVNVNNMGIPTATEFLDLISPQYVADLISWGAIGARTTESQVHRELASGLSCPVGFKNATDGGSRVAIDAISSSSRPHVFLSVTKQGKSAIFSTSGNEDCHIILRGGAEPNYDASHVEAVAQDMESSSLVPNLMIDFSHANSQKQFKKQIDVAENVSQQVADGDKRIIGAMIESHLVEGRQNCNNKEDLQYGQSITDACINWEDSLNVLKQLSKAVQQRRLQQSSD